MPKIPQVLADPAGLGRRAVPRDFGSGEGMAALGQTATELGDISLQLFEQEMTAKVSGALGEATRALNDLSLEVDAEPDHHKRNQMYAEGSGKIANQFREGLRYPKFQGLFDERLAGTLERGRMGIAQGVRQAQVDKASAERRLFIESQLDSLENISDPTERVQTMNAIRDELQEGVRGGLWSSADAATMQIAAENRVAGQELLAEAQAFADGVRDLPAAEQIAAVRALPPGKMRAQVDALVHHQVDADASLQRAAHEKSTDALYFQVEAGRWEDGTPVTPETVLAKAEAAGLGMEETNALLTRIPRAGAEATKSAFAARSKELRESLEALAMRGSTQRDFFGLDFYERAPVIDEETGEQATDGNDLPMFKPSIASLLTGPDLKALNEMQKAGPADKRVVRGAPSTAARDEYLMAINEEWAAEGNSLWDLDEEERVKRSRAIQHFDDAVAHKMEAESREWLYPDELRDITRKLLTPQVLNTGEAWFEWEEKILPWELTPAYLDEQMGSMKDIATYPLEAAADEVAQMDERVVAEIRQRDRPAIGKPPIGDGNDVDSLRAILQIRRLDLDRMSQGIFR